MQPGSPFMLRRRRQDRRGQHPAHKTRRARWPTHADLRLGPPFFQLTFALLQALDFPRDGFDVRMSEGVAVVTRKKAVNPRPAPSVPRTSPHSQAMSRGKALGPQQDSHLTRSALYSVEYGEAVSACVRGPHLSGAMLSVAGSTRNTTANSQKSMAAPSRRTTLRSLMATAKLKVLHPSQRCNRRVLARPQSQAAGPVPGLEAAVNQPGFSAALRGKTALPISESSPSAHSISATMSHSSAVLPASAR